MLFPLFQISYVQAARLEVGHQFEEMIAKCTFRGRDCTDEKYAVQINVCQSSIKMDHIFIDRNFLKISTATYGNCFTFNSWYRTKHNLIKDHKIQIQIYASKVFRLEQEYNFVGRYAQSSGGTRKSSLPGPGLGLELVVSI